VNIGPWQVSRVGGRLTARLLLRGGRPHSPAAGAGWAALQRPKAAGYGFSHIPIHYADKSEMERKARYAFMGWSAQQDRHGAFKLKPRYARFQLVLNKF